ncbi:GlsB/YeaQ/YmgE family stress response membrane protein [Bryobacter aggregatus]|uniref:GlsB/YeaQ/YmgE family stress response membrane protein n=1 Tax=Bryobacter aggregatus TaxID=360054 RepID=UPI0004E17F18|nr:GlsB/YeaQ/YmgE family stress response membrane protein [Bryobacter aggregatus]
MSSAIGWIVFGLIVGVIAKLVTPGRDPGGFIVTILLGIGGAMLGGWVGQLMGLYQNGQAAGWIMSVLGAVVILLAYRMFSRGTTASV